MKKGRLFCLGVVIAFGGITSCNAAIGSNRHDVKTRAKDDMVKLPGGTFWMGTDDQAFPDAQPSHLVTVGSFWIDKHEVTNLQFKKFVDATGYKTVAERVPLKADYPGVAEKDLVPGSMVFSAPKNKADLTQPRMWWCNVAGACWKHPEGPGSDLKGRWNHPVVHVTWQDATEYAKWANKRLPTEAEFEYAARGGLDRKKYSWGDELLPNKRFLANLWQGKFPNQNSNEDGFVGTAPVGSYPANKFGLFDMTGNVWEWCADWYRPDYFASTRSEKPLINPGGPLVSHDPQEPGSLKRVIKGGSYLCTDQYCSRYIVGSRGKCEHRSSLSNVGFRCVRDE